MSVTAVPLQPVKRAYKVWLGVGVVAAAALALALAWHGTRAQVAAKGTNEQFLAWNKGQPGVVTLPSGVEYLVLKPGTGPNPSDGDYVVASYVGKLRDGTVFDRSERPMPFPLQPGSAIPGFLESLKHVQTQGKYRFWLPAAQAYGENPPPGAPIPANAVLVFDVSVERILPAAVVQQMMMQQMMQQQQQGGAGAPPQGAPQPGGQ
ncbi:FKBP-type peptidyl-prolyl cis-trans isomerase [Sphingomonas sp. CJ20]